MPDPVDHYILKHPGWKAELILLRDLLRATPMQEDLKWGAPVYSLAGKNLVGIGAFKNHCALWFFQGALFKKNTDLLQNVQEGKTRALRQIRFKKGEPIPIEVLEKYIAETLENQVRGVKMAQIKRPPLEIPVLLEYQFQKDPLLLRSFKALSPGKQREYCQYIAEAKREETRIRRLEKILPMIQQGRGLNEAYRK